MKVSIHKMLMLLLLFLSACSSNSLPKYTVVQGLRVLALVSDAPEINFDGASFTPTTVNITPVVSDLYGSGRTLNYNLEWCLDLGIGLGATPTCVGNPTRKILATDQAVGTTATFLAPNYTGTLGSSAVDFSAATPTSLALISQKFSLVGSAAQYNGLALLVVYEIYPSGSPAQKISSFKRIVFSSGTKVTKNINPSGLEIRKDGSEISGLPSIESTMDAYLPANQAESYSWLNADGSTSIKTENLDTTWFLTGPSDIDCSKKKECSTDGLFLLSRTRLGELNTFYIPQVDVPATRGRVLIAVARDDRGGAMVKRYCTGVCP